MNFISERMKELIRVSRFTYETFATNVGLCSKQNLSHWLNHKKDEEWAYVDIKNFCRVLGVDHIQFLKDFDGHTKRI